MKRILAMSTSSLKKVGCEGAKERIQQVEEAEPLSSNDAAWYRSVSMRLAYLAQDRPDLQVLAKELAKGLKSPTTVHVMMPSSGAPVPVPVLRASPDCMGRRQSCWMFENA